MAELSEFHFRAEPTIPTKPMIYLWQGNTQCYFYIIASVTVLMLLHVRVLRASNRYPKLSIWEIKKAKMVPY